MIFRIALSDRIIGLFIELHYAHRQFHIMRYLGSLGTVTDMDELIITNFEGTLTVLHFAFN